MDHNQIELLFQNERFISCILNGNEESSVSCKLVRLILKEQFIQCGAGNYGLTRNESLVAYHRAVAQVWMEVKSNRVDVNKTHLETRCLTHYGYDALLEITLDKLRKEAAMQQNAAMDY